MSDLNTAYQTIFDGEKQMLIDLKTLIAKFVTDFNDLVGTPPANVPQTDARRFIQRFQGNVTAMASYELDAALRQYGEGVEAVTPPAGTTVYTTPPPAAA